MKNESLTRKGFDYNALSDKMKPKMINHQINAALHGYLLEPLTDEQRAALSAARHFDFDSMHDESLISARAVAKRNAARPTNFTASLDACRFIEERLDKSFHLRYASLLMTRAGHGWEGLVFASALDRAQTLIEVLELTPGE